MTDACPSFLSGGSTMGELMRAYNWSATPIGRPESWPAPLRTAVGLMLTSKQPTLVTWGPSQTAFYNDAYIPIAGLEPPSIARPLVELWQRAWDKIGPICEAALAGDAQLVEELALGPAGDTRNMRWFNLALTPLRDETNAVAGLFCTVADITDRKQAEAALRDSEERLRLAMDGAQIGLWDWDLAQTRGWWSPRTAQIMGVESGENITLQQRIERIHPDDRARLRAQLEAALAAGHEFVHEYRIIRPDGAVRHISSRGIVIRNAADEAVRTTGIVVDVTEEREAEARLRESEQRLRRTQDAGGVGGYEWDIATGLGQQSDSMLRMIGLTAGRAYTLKEVIGTVVTEDRPQVLATVSAIGAGAERAETDYRVRWPDGTVRWIRDIGQLERDAAGRPARWVGIAQDVTERKEAELALRDNEERLRLGLAAGRMVTWEIDVDTGAVDRSQNAETIFGPGTQADDFTARMPPEDAEADAACLEAAIAGRAPRYENEFRYRHPDGRLMWLHNQGQVVRDADGRAIRMYGVCIDITARKEAETALQRLNEDLKRRIADAVTEREAVLAQLHEAQKLETLGQLTGGVAHDFNNLLTPIVGSLDLLQRRFPDDPRAARLINGALQAADRAQTLVARLLAFGRRQVLQPRPVDVAELLRGVTELIQRSIGQHIGVVVQPAPGLPPARVDPNQLELAILNLAVNARDAMPDGGTISLAAKVDTVGPDNDRRLAAGRYIRLSVTDTGAGMDEETLKRAIEPFFTTKDVGKGTGLGLSMIHGLAGQLGGALKLSSTVGVGTRVDLWLPAADAAAGPEEIPGLGNRPADAPTSSATILLVDDEELVRVGTAEMLTDLGYAVIEATSGGDALRAIDNGRPVDMVVTDYLMPGMNGAQLVEAMRRRRPDLPALIISGFADVDRLPQKVALLTKPFRRDTLAVEVAALLDADYAGAQRRAPEPAR